ncbi:hypothetical protein ACFQYP_34915 [Nonomuraea antimicrobica]
MRGSRLTTTIEPSVAMIGILTWRSTVAPASSESVTDSPMPAHLAYANASSSERSTSADPATTLARGVAVSCSPQGCRQPPAANASRLALSAEPKPSGQICTLARWASWRLPAICVWALRLRDWPSAPY